LCIGQGRVLVAVNAAFVYMLGYPEAKLLATDAYAFIHPDDLQASTNAHRILRDGQEIHQFENRWRHADGHYIWLSWTIRRMANGYAYCVVRDITQTKTEQRRKEQALRQSEERYRALVQSQSDLICRFDLDTTLTFVNDAYARFYRSTPEALVGRSFLEHINPATHHEVRARLDQLRIDPSPSKTSFPWVSPEGRTYWIEWVDLGILDEDGTVIEFQAAGRDITHLKEVEHALRVQEEHYRSLFEFNPLPMWVYDRQTRRFLEVNKAAIERYGYTRDEFLAMTIADIRPTSQLSRLQEVLDGNTHGFYHGKGWVHRKKDGTEIEVEIASHDVVFDNQPSRLVSAVDVTERMMVERALRESEETFRTMLEAASQGVVLLDGRGQIRVVNVYIEQLFGYDRSELLGQSALHLIPPDMHERFVSLQVAFSRNARFMRFSEQEGLTAVTKHGHRIPVEVTLTPISIQGEPMVLCLMSDLTERKQLADQRLYVRELEVKLEKDRELLNLKERFVTIVSHEFRTPLAVILSSVYILRRYHLSLSAERALEKMDAIADNVRRMVKLLEDVLTISTGNADRILFRPEQLSVAELCASLAETIRQADNHQHPILVTLTQDTTTIYGDRRLLEHILINLMGNATKYSPVGKPVRLDVTRQTNPPNIVFTISDEGMGIPPTDQARLFQPFHRAENVSGIEGTGLGLAIVKQSVEEHAGTITFTSELGKGTTFVVTLPQHDAPPED
jgi:PAS domain S-box-containing protein